VFFLSTARLTAQDTDGQLDVYDAHECSLSPCITSPVVNAPSLCTSGETCRPTSSTQAVFGTLPSEAFSGNGNLAGAQSPSVKPRSLTRAQRLASALSACRGRPKRLRARCRATARRRYGARPKSGKSKHSRRTGR
jgi:hypothetical protein